MTGRQQLLAMATVAARPHRQVSPPNPEVRLLRRTPRPPQSPAAPRTSLQVGTTDPEFKARGGAQGDTTDLTWGGRGRETDAK